ncbi:hypothetical protein ACJX0J_036793 [Zea mays]
MSGFFMYIFAGNFFPQITFSRGTNLNKYLTNKPHYSTIESLGLIIRFSLAVNQAAVAPCRGWGRETAVLWTAREEEEEEEGGEKEGYLSVPVWEYAFIGNQIQTKKNKFAQPS